MSYFLKEGNIYRVFHNDSIDLEKTLPVGNYVVKFDEFRNEFFLERVDDFEITNKLYGDVQKNANRILNTFGDRPNATGVILSGEKGSGKTLLTKMISVNGKNFGYPTIIINSAWCGDIFNAFIQNINQPAIILFDEFEKVYEKKQQEAVLTLLDGVFPTKKLFLLTCNDKWQIDVHMRNRPGRIFYMLEFDGLELDFIKEYCEDTLIDKSQIDSVCKVSGAFSPFNFDMLKALIEEMNRYGESAIDAIRMLNVKPEYSANGKYNTKLFFGDDDISHRIDSDHRSFELNPISQKFWFGYYEDEEKDKYESSYISPNEITAIDYSNMTYEYRVGDFTLKLIRQKENKNDRFFYHAF